MRLNNINENEYKHWNKKKIIMNERFFCKKFNT